LGPRTIRLTARVGYDPMIVRPRLPVPTGKEKRALLGAEIYREKACYLEAPVMALDLVLGADVKRKRFFNGQAKTRRHSAKPVHFGHQLVDLLHLAGSSNLIDKYLLIAPSFVDGRIGGAGQCAAIPGERMDARIGSAIPLQSNLMLKDFRKPVSVRAREQDNSVALVNEMLFNILKHLRFDKLLDELLVSL